MSLLDVTNLQTTFFTDDGRVGAVDGVSFSVERGQVLGIVGESGCGKSVTMLSIMRLLSEKNSTTEGEVLFEGDDLLDMPNRQMQRIRGSAMAKAPLRLMTERLTGAQHKRETSSAWARAGSARRRDWLQHCGGQQART